MSGSRTNYVTLVRDKSGQLHLRRRDSGWEQLGSDKVYTYIRQSRIQRSCRGLRVSVSASGQPIPGSDLISSCREEEQGGVTVNLEGTLKTSRVERGNREGTVKTCRVLREQGRNSQDMSCIEGTGKEQSRHVVY